MPVDCSLFLLNSNPPTHNFYIRNQYEFTGLKSHLNYVASRHARLRSCLSSELEKRENVMNSLAEANPALPPCKVSTKSKIKKRVSFADSKGLSLTSVRIMQEPSDMPPALNIQAIGDLIRDETPEPSSLATNFIIDFEQPASNYLEFRERLERENVGLENVIIKDSNTIMGTVKVRNLAFEKSVRIRMSLDDWATHKDIMAIYSPPSYAFGLEGTTPEKYDTFSFEFEIPPNSNTKNIEFCVCFEANGQSYWDSNNGNNYKVTSEEWKTVSQQAQMEDDYRDLRISSHVEWSGFSYWKSTAGESDLPYW